MLTSRYSLGMGTWWTVAGRPAWDLEEIVLDGRDCWRVRHYGALIGYCYSVPELEQVLGGRDVKLADLVEVREPGPP